MNIIFDEMCSGKTKKLIQESSDTGAIIVTASDFKAKHLKDKAEAYEIPIPDPVSWYYAMNNYAVAPNTVYLVDDVDEVLESMLKRPVRTATLTKEN